MIFAKILSTQVIMYRFGEGTLPFDRQAGHYKSNRTEANGFCEESRENEIVSRSSGISAQKRRTNDDAAPENPLWQFSRPSGCLQGD
jgi:hypothetical protein